MDPALDHGSLTPELTLCGEVTFAPVLLVVCSCWKFLVSWKWLWKRCDKWISQSYLKCEISFWFFPPCIQAINYQTVSPVSLTRYSILFSIQGAVRHLPFILKRAIAIEVCSLYGKKRMFRICECENTDGLRETCIQMACAGNLVRGESDANVAVNNKLTFQYWQTGGF